MKKLEAKWATGRFVCLSLDPIISKMPTHLQSHETEEMMDRFFTGITNATADLVAAFKLNISFFKDLGNKGVDIYHKVREHIQRRHPHIVLINDVDAGSAEFFFDRRRFDAIIVHNDGGPEPIRSFLDRGDKGVFVLCRTADAGSGDIQNRMMVMSEAEADMFCLPSLLPVLEMTAEEAQMNRHRHKPQPHYMPQYQYVAARANNFWNKKDNCGLLVSAFDPEAIANVRRVAPKLPLFIDGVGRGGNLEKSVSSAHRQFLINSSNDILYASCDEDFVKATRAKVVELEGQIRAALLPQR